jgi:hypothetical protein
MFWSLVALQLAEKIQQRYLGDGVNRGFRHEVLQSRLKAKATCDWRVKALSIYQSNEPLKTAPSLRMGVFFLLIFHECSQYSKWMRRHSIARRLF